MAFCGENQGDANFYVSLQKSSLQLPLPEFPNDDS